MQTSTSLECAVSFCRFAQAAAIAQTPSSRHRFYAVSSRLLFPPSRDRASLNSLSPCQPFLSLCPSLPSNPPLILSFVLDFIRTKLRAMNAAVVNWSATEGDRHTDKQTAGVAPRRPNTPIKPDLSSALPVASLLMTALLAAPALLAATALFFALALLPLAFLSLAIFVLAALLSGTTRFARFVRIVL